MLTPTARIQARLLVVLTAVAAAWVALRVYPEDLPSLSGQPHIVDLLFQSRPMVFAGRVTLLCLAAFVIVSIVARVLSREWLRKAGPFEVSTVASDAETERDALGQDLADAQAMVRTLLAQVVNLTERVAVLTRSSRTEESA